ncbi:hypothetical protein HK44_022165 [Pseudomonas fluorescens HK44]|uniref:HTH araC/xylS-type domain-containing protein n=1 Tax=Pseudomonas fluorescens HK44 TaxID=1042209 RepID=A0A010SUD9_PSEFL|nr:hypothetical protein HK44_022165 [Pseudomonas fluorescens HK44]
MPMWPRPLMPRRPTLSPVQYLKRLRLLKAQQLLLLEGLGVAQVVQVAQRVGYQSTLQFSREYQRYFERNPGRRGWLGFQALLQGVVSFSPGNKKAPIPGALMFS